MRKQNMIFFPGRVESNAIRSEWLIQWLGIYDRDKGHTRMRRTDAARMTDLNPIEHLWDKVKHHVYGDGKQYFRKQSKAFHNKSHRFGK